MRKVQSAHDASDGWASFMAAPRIPMTATPAQRHTTIDTTEYET